MKEYDVIVIGSGAALFIVEEALKHGLKTALVDKGPAGGTCLNYGCIPSKVLIHPADVIEEIKDSGKLGITAEIKNIDFKNIMERMKENVFPESRKIRESLEHALRQDYYEGVGRFVSDYTISVNDILIKGKKIFIANGARPKIPDIKGLKDFLTNETILDLESKPKSIAIIGGGYIGCEYAHFFSAIGTKVHLIHNGQRLLADEEPEISETLKKSFDKRMKVYLKTEVTKIEKVKGYKIFLKSTNTKQSISCDKMLVATGRASNADILDVKKTGIKTDDEGYIIVNEYFETSKKNIWAFGDVIGKYQFRHVANAQAAYVMHNGIHNKKLKMDLASSPHAVFSYPQIASVGMTEDEARRKKLDFVIGHSRYLDVAKGAAMVEREGFAKAIIETNTDKILGFHIIGPQASVLIQEVVNNMAMQRTRSDILGAMHIHPALSEVVVNALVNVRHTHSKHDHSG